MNAFVGIWPAVPVIGSAGPGASSDAAGRAVPGSGEIAPGGNPAPAGEAPRLVPGAGGTDPGASSALPTDEALRDATQAAATFAAAEERAAEFALVARARAGDSQAFRALVERHATRVHALALRIVRSPADAEEVAQDAFVRAWRALPAFRGESAFGTWLHRIVARVALDRAAALRSRSAREVPEVERTPPATTDALDDAAAERSRRVERLVGTLTPMQRATITLYYWHDHSVEQVADILGLPGNTVKTHLSRARATLRDAWLRGETS